MLGLLYDNGIRKGAFPQKKNAFWNPKTKPLGESFPKMRVYINGYFWPTTASKLLQKVCGTFVG